MLRECPQSVWQPMLSLRQLSRCKGYRSVPQIAYKAVAEQADGNTALQPLSSLNSREALRQAAPKVFFRVKGVSFENRQDAVKNLDKGQAVMLLHEPSNPYDPHAVRILSLAGQQLGYVPRNINQSPAFRRHEDLAHIVSSGPTKDIDPELHGALVEQQPQLEPLLASAIPENLQEDCIDIGLRLDPNTWQQISAAQLAAANGRCMISGGTKEALAVVPVWQADEDRKRMVLKSFRVISELLKRAQDIFLQDTSADREAAWTFQSMNGWTRQEAESYRQHQRHLIEERAKALWGMDLSLLQEMQIKIPQSLKAYVA